MHVGQHSSEGEVRADLASRCTLAHQQGGQGTAAIKGGTSRVQRYILQRILLAIPTVILISILTFVILRVALPSSVVDNILGEYGRNDPALRKRITDELGLSASIPNQYFKYMVGVLQGDLWKSIPNG